MKKKFRNITVNDVEYAWASRVVDGQHLTLKIWHDKKVIYDKPVGIYAKAVTPKMVKYIIERLTRKQSK